MSSTLDEQTVNITPTSSGKGLKQALVSEADKRAMKIRPFVREIYFYAVNHRELFTGPLHEPLEKPGEHIGTKVSEVVANQLMKWAKERNTSRGLHCKYILEKALQDGLIKHIFDE